MTKPKQAELARRDCPVSSNPMSFSPRQIIYRKLLPNRKLPNDSVYETIFKPVHSTGQRFEDFMRFVGIYGYSSRHLDPRENHALDIPVYQRSAIVIQLPFNSEFYFAHPAIYLTTDDANCLDHLYGELRYVSRTGRITERPVDPCKTVYFVAERQTGEASDPYLQAFNYNVEPLGRRFLMIDPDIRHPGNGGSGAVEEGSG